MPESVQVDAGRRILRIEPLTSEELSVSFFGSLETAREKRLAKILVDARRIKRAPRLVTILGIILMSPEGLRVALQYRPDQAQESELRIAREAATNLAKPIRIFTNETSGLDWLQAEE